MERAIEGLAWRRGVRPQVAFCRVLTLSMTARYGRVGMSGGPVVGSAGMTGGSPLVHSSFECVVLLQTADCMSLQGRFQSGCLFRFPVPFAFPIQLYAR